EFDQGKRRARSNTTHGLDLPKKGPGPQLACEERRRLSTRQFSRFLGQVTGIWLVDRVWRAEGPRPLSPAQPTNCIRDATILGGRACYAKGVVSHSPGLRRFAATLGVDSRCGLPRRGCIRM